MRRKSPRTTQKVSPEKTKSPSSRKTRRYTRHRKQSTSDSSEDSQDGQSLQEIARKAAETKGQTVEEEGEGSAEAVWKVTPSSQTLTGEVQKLKLCLTRPGQLTPERSSRRQKSGSTNEGSSTQEDEKSSEVEDKEDKRGKGKSKGKHKSKVEKTPQTKEEEAEIQSEISENVQVTAQSPPIDIPVDKCNTEEDGPRISDNCASVEDNINRNSTQNRDEVHSSENNVTVTVSPELQSKNHSEQETTQNESENSQELPDTPRDDITENDCKIKSKENNAVLVEKERESVEEENETVCMQEENGGAQKERESTTKCKQDESAPEESETVQKVEENASTKNETMHNMEEIQFVYEKTVSAHKETESANEEHEVIPKENEKKQVEDENLTTDTMASSTLPDIEEKEIPELKQDVCEASQLQNAEVDAEQRSDVNSETQDAIQEEPLEKQDARATSVGSPENQPSQNESTTNEPYVEYMEVDISESDYFKILSEEKQEEKHEKPTKKRKWGTSNFGFDMYFKNLVKVDVDSIKSFCSELKLVQEDEVKLKSTPPEERRKSVELKQKKHERKLSADDPLKPDFEARSTVTSEENSANIIAMNRKISIVDDTAGKLKPPPSPAKNPISDILYITNLVRPFTLKQLKELLERTGNIKDDGFWTDRIKSKCYVQYTTVEEAEATRNALHGVQWPIGNGKKLIIEYGTLDEMDKAKNPPQPPVVVDIKPSEKDNEEPAIQQDKDDVGEKKEKRRKDVQVREWDIGKEDMENKKLSGKEYMERKQLPRRSQSPVDDFIARKKKKQEEAPPQKLMDDLFQKTKATPCIYWLPLTPEEIVMKQQQRLIRMEEHKRRLEEAVRNRGEYGRGGGGGGGPYRRRYD